MNQDLSIDIPHSNSRDYQMLYVKLSKFEIGQVEVEPLRGTTFSGKVVKQSPVDLDDLLHEHQ